MLVFWKPTDKQEISQVVKEIKSSISPGIDSISKQDILFFFDIIGETLVPTYNMESFQIN